MFFSDDDDDEDDLEDDEARIQKEMAGFVVDEDEAEEESDNEVDFFYVALFTAVHYFQFLLILLPIGLIYFCLVKVELNVRKT